MSDDERAGVLGAAATALYGVVPGEFVAARDARVREARAGKDRDLAAALRALRRPSVAAWAVNALVRAHGDAVAGLLGLGEELRAAQDALAGEDLRRLGREQRAALASARSLVADVADEAGQPLTEATWRQVEGTLRAAMADADAAVAVRSGRLVEPLEPTGFGEVDVTDAVAVPEAAPVLPPGPVPARRSPAPAGRAPASRAERPERAEQAERGERGRVERAERERAERAERERVEHERAEALSAELAEAERLAAEARAAERSAGEAVERLSARRAGIAARLAELTVEIDELRAEDRTLSREEHTARAHLGDAERRARAAVRALETLRRRTEQGRSAE